MKSKLLFIIALLFTCSTAIAEGTDEPLTEEQCKIFVANTLTSINDQSKRYGEDVKLDDLSEQNILDIQGSKGNCEAMREINLRYKRMK